MGSRRASPLAVAARKRTDRLALAQEHGEAGFGGQALPECVRGSPGRPVGRALGVRMGMSGISIRPARAGEGPDLTELAPRAKSHWGYGEPFLAAARATLTIDAGTISSARVYVAEQDGATAGFYGLTGEPPSGVLEWMFLEPHAIGRGYGRRRSDDAVTWARAAGFSELLIESDRFAEDFYLTMGAVRVGAAASPVDGVPLPLLKIKLASEAG